MAFSGICRAQVIEFGTGDGSPVIHALESWGRYGGVIHGFEINPSAAAAARNNAAAHGVTNSYKVAYLKTFCGVYALPDRCWYAFYTCYNFS